MAASRRHPAVVLLNRAAATARQRDLRPDALAERLAAAGFPAEVAVVPGEELGAAARRAVADGAPVVVAVGGDGTVGTVAGAVAGTATALGVLPLGAFNHFARDAGIPADLAAAAAVLAAGRRRRVDVAEVSGSGGGEPFPMVNNAILGFYPKAVQRRRSGGGRRLRKALWTLAALVPTLRRPPFLDLRLEGDGERRRATTPFVFIGNNEYRMSLFSFGARPRLDEGRLFVSLVRSSSRRSLLPLLLLYAVSDLGRHRRVEQWSAGELTVAADERGIELFIDGEVHRLAPPLRFRTRPGALEVVAPPEEGMIGR